MIEWRIVQLQRFKETRMNEWFSSLIKLENELSIRFSDNLLRNKIRYEKRRYRYFIFTMDFAKFIKAKSSYGYYYIHNARYCNKRNDIGNILNQYPLKFLIVYYSTSKKIKFYIHFGSEIMKLTLKQLKKFNVYQIKKWLNEKV